MFQNNLLTTFKNYHDLLAFLKQFVLEWISSIDRDNGYRELEVFIAEERLAFTLPDGTRHFYAQKDILITSGSLTLTDDIGVTIAAKTRKAYDNAIKLLTNKENTYDDRSDIDN